MAELAAGAVQTLLGVIRDETHLLGRVETDVKFIKEEMESMNSFLLHLSRTVPPGADEHSEQVRTWMKQVRELAHDCGNSIDRYLQRGNLFRTRGPLGHIFLWLPWYLQKLAAQHKAAIQLRELKERARDIGKRRLRYDVKIPKLPGHGDDTPTRATIAGSSSSQLAGQVILVGEDEEEDDDGPEQIEDRLVRRAHAFSEPSAEYHECRGELVDWLVNTPITQDGDGNKNNLSSNEFSTIAIVSPNQKDGVKVASGAIADDVLKDKFQYKFPVNVFMEEDTMTLPALPAGPLDILQAIMKQLYPNEQNNHDSAKVRVRKEKVEIEEVNQEQNKKQKAGDQEKIQHIDVKIQIIKEKIQGHLLAMRRSGVTIPVDEHSALNMLLGCIQYQQWSPRILIFEAHEPGESNAQIYKRKIENTAKKIKGHIESTTLPVGLDYEEYVQILRDRLCPSDCKVVNQDGQGQGDGGEAHEEGGGEQGQREATNQSDEDPITKHISEIIKKIKDKPSDEQIMDHIKETAEKIMVNKLLLLLKPTEAAEKKATDTLGGQMPEDSIELMMTKINGALEDIKKKLQSKMANEIKKKVKGKKTLIFLIGMDYLYKWDDIIKALSSLHCASGSAVVVTTKYSHRSKEFCNPPREPILCYPAGSYYKKVLNIMMKQPIKYNTSIFCDILERCEPDQFSMKIFAHAMYANPRRKEGDLHNLLATLNPGGSLEDTNDKKMIKFSYNDLTKDYQTCLLYLAIFQPKETINRSRLVGRWVVEGLITREDWSSSVHGAERCFDALVNRLLICPEDIGAIGKVKSCTVDATVHEFITKIAKKQHIVETRLSHHLAKHFSVFSDIRLRRSDDMKNFFKKLNASPQLRLVKVLDLQDCKELDKNCLKHICNKMILLKYLSLRNTGIKKLPSEINNLHQLEVLDIRQNNMIDPLATRDVLLFKLKRLLAGGDNINDQCLLAGGDNIKDRCPTNNLRIPRGIGKMTNLEVLSRVKARQKWAGPEMEDIGKLFQLRKLGLVIEDDNQLRYFLRAISDLKECLESLSITLANGGKKRTRSGATTTNQDTANSHTPNPPTASKEDHANGATTSPPSTSKGDTTNGTTPSGATPSHPRASEGDTANGGTPSKATTSKGDNAHGATPSATTSSKGDIVNGGTPSTATPPKRGTGNSYTPGLATASKRDIANGATPSATTTSKGGTASGGCPGPTTSKGDTSVKYFENNPPKCLQSLSINGFKYNPGQLLPLLLRGKILPAVTKLTLCNTFLHQDSMKSIAEMPNLLCLRLKHDAYIEHRLSFTSSAPFKKLKYLLVDGCCKTIEMIFEYGGAPELIKIIWSFTCMEESQSPFLSGIIQLLKLKELDFHGNEMPNQVMEDKEKHQNKDLKINLTQAKPKHAGQEASTTAVAP